MLILGHGCPLRLDDDTAVDSFVHGQPVLFESGLGRSLTVGHCTMVFYSFQTRCSV